TNVTDKAQEIVGNVQDKFNQVKNKITEPIRKAKDKIGEYVDAIKGFFSNLKLEIPTPKLPKLPSLSVTGGSGFIPSMPKISWNAEGGVFKNPQIFTTQSAGLQGVGEAGAEAIIPLRSNVLAGIGKGIAKTMNVKQPTNNNSTYNISLNVENMNGTKKDATFVLNEFV